jgi:preprotein translocase subunit Sss1
MGNSNLGQLGVGTKEPIRLTAEKVRVVSFLTENVEKKSTGKVVGEKVVLICKHPSREEPIELSSITCLVIKGKSREVKTVGSWVNLDEDGQIAKYSSLATMLNFYKVKSVSELVNKEIETELDDSGYLSIKAY